MWTTGKAEAPARASSSSVRSMITPTECIRPVSPRAGVFPPPPAAAAASSGIVDATAANPLVTTRWSSSVSAFVCAAAAGAPASTADSREAASALQTLETAPKLAPSVIPCAFANRPAAVAPVRPVCASTTASPPRPTSGIIEAYSPPDSSCP